jgi:aromatic ring-opening dioxygenase catalytic subunit (LigB family)
MAEIVAAITCSHAPGLAMRPEPDAEGRKQRFYDGVKEAGRLLAATQPTAVLFVSNEHLQNFFLNNWPAFCLAFPEQMEGPIETWMPIPRYKLRGDPEFGQYLLQAALDAHFDLASSQELQPDHAVILPLHHLQLGTERPVTILLQNCVQPPYPTLQRCVELGRFLARAIAAWPKPERFALIGVGGISHWIGVKNMGTINAEWDHWFLDQISRGKVDELARITPDELARDAGNGGEEIRNWLTVAAAVGERQGSILTYEPVADWVCGCGCVFWDLTDSPREAVAPGAAATR